MEVENIVGKILEEILVFLESPMTPSFSTPVFEPKEEEPFAYEHQETEEYLREEIFQWIQLYQQEFPLTLSKPSYYHDITQAILEVVYPQWEKEPFIQEFATEEDIGQIIYEMVCQFCPKRYSLFSPTAPEDPHQYKQALETWQQKFQTLQQVDEQNPKQGTTAWLKQRYNMITASDAYKALTSEAQRNNIIKAKSQPFQCYGTEDEDGQRQQQHGPASMAWGHMFEPISVQIYEHLTGEKVLFMGCIPHPLLPYLGASPDGVISPWETDGGRCQRVQRILEIKNPISREIDGIPSEAYWIQQQIQMEVCDMEGCDFFETTFKTMDDLSILFPPFLLPRIKEEVSGLSSEMSSDSHPQNNINDRPPTQDAENPPSSIPKTPTIDSSLYYGVIVEYSYRKWGEPFPSIKRLYLPPLTPFVSSHPLYTTSSNFEFQSGNAQKDSEEEQEQNTDDEDNLQDDDHSLPDTPEDYEIPLQPPLSEEEEPQFHYVMDIKTNQFFDHPNTLQEHIDNQIPKNHPEAPEYKLSKKIYWKLENASLLFVQRNREWMEAAKPRLQEVWQTIQQTRDNINSTAPLPIPSSEQETRKHISISSSKNLKDWFG